MKKIIIKTDLKNLNGLNYHRLLVPYTKVSDLDEFKCDVFPDVSLMTDEDLSSYDAIVYQREIDINGKSKELIDRYQRLGLKVIFDIDDYWHLPQTHHLYLPYKKFNIPKQTEEILKLVDLVTCTTENLAIQCRKFNKNVEVIPNCLDISEGQWQSSKIESDKVRFGYVAGVHHIEDIKIMDKGITKALFSKLDCQFILGGYTDNAHYHFYESVMSCNGTAKGKYKRIDALPVNKYGYTYNQTDVSLVPLVSSIFTPYKSEIKLLEAAAHNNAAIVSNWLPYNTFPKECALWINDESDWYKAIRELNNNKNLREDKSAELSGYVKLNYDLNKWTQVRKQILRSVLA